MKLALSLALALSALSATAHAKDPLLLAAATEQCKIPNDMNRYAVSAVNYFLHQAQDPSFKMLNIAFIRNITSTSSRYIPLAYCIVVFLGKPNDPYWEKNAKNYEKAKEAGVLPELVFDRLEGETVILKPVGDAVN